MNIQTSVCSAGLQADKSDRLIRSYSQQSMNALERKDNLAKVIGIERSSADQPAIHVLAGE